jgi:hypothetical protein
MPIKNGISALHTSTSEMRLFIIERKICEEKHQRKKKKKKKCARLQNFLFFGMSNVKDHLFILILSF